MASNLTIHRNCWSVALQFCDVDDLRQMRFCSKTTKDIAERCFNPVLQKWRKSLEDHVPHINVFEKLQRILSFSIVCRRADWVETICLIYKNHKEWMIWHDDSRSVESFEHGVIRRPRRGYWDLRSNAVPFTLRNDETVLPPLHQAAFVGDAASIAVLLKAGTKVNYVYKHHYKGERASFRGWNYREDYEDRTENFGSPLFIACSRGHYEAAQMLLENGADANGADNSYSVYVSEWVRKVPLFEVIRRGDRRMAALLLQHNASVTIREGLGFGPTAQEFDKKGILNQSGCCAIL